MSGKSSRGLDEVARMVVVGDGAQRQPLVQADAPDPELARPLEHRVGDLLVVHEPAAVESLGRGARVALPGVDLERGRLQVHEVEVGLAELRRDEPVGQHPARLRDAVDLVADVGHLLGRHDRLLGIRPGRRRDEPDGRLAVEEHFLDEVLPRRSASVPLSDASFGFSRRARWRSPSSACLRHRRRGSPPSSAGSYAGADVVELHVEDEERRARALLERGRLGRLDREHVEEAAEHRVHGEERRRHPAARPEEVPPAEPEPRGQPRRLGEDAVLHRPLGGRLRQRRELLVGDEPRRQRHLGARPWRMPGRTWKAWGFRPSWGGDLRRSADLEPTLSTAA